MPNLNTIKKTTITKERFLSKNIDYLLKVNEMDAKSLSLETGIPATTISRLRQTDCNPTFNSIEPIAVFFRVDINDLLYEDMSSDNYQSKEGVGKITYIPVVKLEHSIVFTEDLKVILFKYAISNVNEKSFGIKIETDSFSPIFQNGSIVIIDPSIEIRDTDYVVCLLEDNRLPILRQVFIEGNNYFFKPINQDNSKMTSYQKFKIIGVVVKVMAYYRR